MTRKRRQIALHSPVAFSWVVKMLSSSPFQPHKLTGIVDPGSRNRLCRDRIFWGLLPTRVILVLAIQFSVLDQSPLRAAEVNESTAFEEARTLAVLQFFQPLVTNFAQLRTGEFEVRGKLSTFRDEVLIQEAGNAALRYPDPELVDRGWESLFEVELKFYSVFDVPRGGYRIDKTERRVVHRDAGRPRVNGNPMSQRRTQLTQWVTTPQMNIQVYPAMPESPPTYLVAGPLAADAMTSKMRAYQLFRPLLDVRSLPLVSFSHLHLLDEDYHTLLQRLVEDYEVVQTEALAGQRTRVTMRLKRPAARGYLHRFEASEAAGGMITYREIVPVEAPDAAIEWSRISWKQMSDVSVPVSYQALRRRPGEVVLLQMLFHWQQVNEPVDESVFTVEGLELPAEAQQVESSRHLQMYFSR